MEGANFLKSTEHFFEEIKDHRSYEIYSGFNFSTATFYFSILNDTESSSEFCLTNCKLSERIGALLGLGNSLATYGYWPRNNGWHLRLRQSHSFRPPFVRMDSDKEENNPVAFRCWVNNCDDLSCAKNVIQQFKYMNFIYSLHIKHFIGMEIFLAIRHEVMFRRDEDFPKCKLSNLEEPNGEGRGELTLIISVDKGGLKLTFAKWEGVQRNFEPHFIHFTTPPPPPSPYPVIITQSLTGQDLISY